MEKPMPHKTKSVEFWPEEINQYTRLLTFPLAIIQSIGSIYLIRQPLRVSAASAEHYPLTRRYAVGVDDRGTDRWLLLLMWLGDWSPSKASVTYIADYYRRIVSRLPPVFPALSAVFPRASTGHYSVRPYRLTHGLRVRRGYRLVRSCSSPIWWSCSTSLA